MHEKARPPLHAPNSVTAEQLEPGLPNENPQSVQALKSELGGGARVAEPIWSRFRPRSDDRISRGGRC